MSEWSTEFPSSFDVGNPSAGHIHMDSNGLVFYGPDGVSIIFELDAATGNVIERGDHFSVIDAHGNTLSLQSEGVLDGGLIITPAGGIAPGGVVGGASVGVGAQGHVSLDPPFFASSGGGFRAYSDDSANNPVGFARMAYFPAGHTLDIDTNGVAANCRVDATSYTVNGGPPPGAVVSAPVVIPVSGAFSADTLLAALPAVPVVAGRVYEFLASVFDLTGGTAGDRFTFRFRAAGVDAASQAVPIPAAITAPPLFAGQWTATFTGNCVFDFRAVRAAGAGTVNVNGGQFWVKAIS